MMDHQQIADTVAEKWWRYYWKDTITKTHSTKECIHAAILEALSLANQWIEVTPETMPPAKSLCLTVHRKLRHGHSHRKPKAAVLWWSGKKFIGIAGVHEHVTHWKPLEFPLMAAPKMETR